MISLMKRRLKRMFDAVFQFPSQSLSERIFGKHGIQLNQKMIKVLEFEVQNEQLEVNQYNDKRRTLFPHSRTLLAPFRDSPR